MLNIKNKKIIFNTDQKVKNKKRISEKKCFIKIEDIKKRKIIKEDGRYLIFYDF